MIYDGQIIQAEERLEKTIMFGLIRQQINRVGKLQDCPWTSKRLFLDPGLDGEHVDVRSQTQLDHT